MLVNPCSRILPAQVPTVFPPTRSIRGHMVCRSKYSGYSCILSLPHQSTSTAEYARSSPKGRVWVVRPGCFILGLASRPCRRPASAASLVYGIRNSILALPQDAFARRCETPSVVSFCFFPSPIFLVVFSLSIFLSWVLVFFLSFGLKLFLSSAIWVCGIAYLLSTSSIPTRNHHLLV